MPISRRFCGTESFSSAFAGCRLVAAAADWFDARGRSSRRDPEGFTCRVVLPACRVVRIATSVATCSARCPNRSPARRSVRITPTACARRNSSASSFAASVVRARSGPSPARRSKPRCTPDPSPLSGDGSRASKRRRRRRCEVLPRQDGVAGWVRVLGEDGRRPAHLRGLLGLIPAEPHTEVADHGGGSQDCRGGVGCA